jgi:hypothetical protein
MQQGFARNHGLSVPLHAASSRLKLSCLSFSSPIQAGLSLRPAHKRIVCLESDQPPPVGRLELLEWKEGSKGGMQALAWCACVPLLCGVWCVVCEASQEACCFDCLWVPPATILHASSTMAGAGGDNTESAH